jgi:hypothetical protein
VADIELGPDQEHVQAHAHLAADVQHVQGGGRKQGRLHAGCECTEQRGTQRDARDHFTDHLRLAEAACQRTRDPAGQDDHPDLQEEVDREL